ncbi:MAG TPA: 2-phosphosulfolactate phosphatase [Ktedonobacterales bacterium]|nr:2-phosphosulfolactate phosphatase [Ktedonobacterales bacterium]
MTSSQPAPDSTPDIMPESPESPVTLSVAHCLDEIDLDPTRRARTAYIVVDVIRATTTLAVMFERGARRVLVARDVDAARAVRASQPQALVAGEVNAVAPSDFDYGNSPEEWSAVDVAGREILFSTTNGARGLHAAMGGGPVFAGCLRNASAVCAAALAAARQLSTPATSAASATPVISATGAIITVVCSGLDDQPSDDDSLCAGWLIQTLQQEARQNNVAVDLGPGAQRALDLLATQRQTYSESDDALPKLWLAGVLSDTSAAQAVLAAGLGADLIWCADVDASTAVPMVAGADASRKLVVVERAPAQVLGIPIGDEIP